MQHNKQIHCAVNYSDKNYYYITTFIMSSEDSSVKEYAKNCKCSCVCSVSPDGQIKCVLSCNCSSKTVSCSCTDKCTLECDKCGGECNCSCVCSVSPDGKPICELTCTCCSKTVSCSGSDKCSLDCC